MKNVDRKWFRELEVPNKGMNLSDCHAYRYNKSKAYEEGFQEFIDFSLKTQICGNTYFVHPNINLYIDMTQACNARCEFCIAKTTFERRNSLPTEAFIEKVERAIDALSHLDVSVQIVGGEPTISRRFVSLLNLLNKKKMRKPVLGTNGIGLKRFSDEINSSIIKHVNVSRHHHDETLNNKIMKFNRLFRNEELFDGISSLRDSIGVRMQCNMIEGYIDDYKDVMDFISWSRDNGIDNLVFAQLTPLPSNDIYQDNIIKYVSDRQVDVNEILRMVDDNPDFEFKKYRGGVACYYEVWKYKGDTTVVFKFSDNSYLVRADNTKRHLPDLVIHTNGSLCGSWNRNVKIILQ